MKLVEDKSIEIKFSMGIHYFNEKIEPVMENIMNQWTQLKKKINYHRNTTDKDTRATKDLKPEDIIRQLLIIKRK